MSDYSFRGRLAESFPSQILMDITEVCNLGCTHCPHPDFKQSQHYTSSYVDPLLNKKMVDEVKTHGKGFTQYIRYASNGEPLIHPNAFDMIDYAVENSGVFVTLTTNGTIMNEKRIQKLMDTGLNMIDISIDAFLPETYKNIRVGGNLETTNKNVDILLDFIAKYNYKTKVVVSFVEQAENTNEVEDFRNYWNKRGASQVLIREMHSCSGAKKEIKFFANGKKKEDGERRPCVYPWERIVINARGDLAFCPSDWVHGSVMANYENISIKEMWNSDFYRELRNAHLTNNFKNHSFCGQCPDWKTTYWPGTDKAYADLITNIKVN
ncbi:radical SAM protein [Methylophilales bacterium]|nr:radical SAM protein [Methylophilales bacterium]